MQVTTLFILVSIMNLLIAITTLMILLNAEAFPSGAPSFVCSSLRPIHGPNQAVGPSPYEVDVSAIDCYVPGQTYDSKLCLILSVTQE